MKKEKSAMQRWLDGDTHPVRDFDEPMFEVDTDGIARYQPDPEVVQSLAEMQQRVYETNVANGWFESDRTFGEDIALLHSEVSEALEAFRDHGVDDMTFDENGEPRKLLTAEDGTVVPKPQGVGAELADVLVRLLDTCHRYNLDLYSEFDRVCRHNEQRSYRHGNKRL